MIFHLSKNLSRKEAILDSPEILSNLEATDVVKQIRSFEKKHPGVMDLCMFIEEIAEEDGYDGDTAYLYSAIMAVYLFEILKFRTRHYLKVASITLFILLSATLILLTQF